ncbi:MAG: hypothetical protein GF355_16450 [Candidatus Eisenbacteria bacterium]|nr:hypothetical protein [Candidatus Eisenbacteria bacterium]
MMPPSFRWIDEPRKPGAGKRAPERRPDAPSAADADHRFRESKDIVDAAPPRVESASNAAGRVSQRDAPPAGARLTVADLRGQPIAPFQCIALLVQIRQPGGQSPGRRLPRVSHLRHPVTIIGSGRAARIRIGDNPGICREHAALVHRDGRFRVHPQEGNVLIDSQPVTAAGRMLEHGARFLVGGAEFLFLTTSVEKWPAGSSSSEGEAAPASRAERATLLEARGASFDPAEHAGVLAVLRGSCPPSPEASRLELYPLRCPVSVLGLSRQAQIRLYDLRGLEAEHGAIVHEREGFRILPREGSLAVDGRVVEDGGRMLENGARIELPGGCMVFLTNVGRSDAEGGESGEV